MLIQVVPHAKAVSRSHYTLSLSGVIAYRVGEEPALTPLEVCDHAYADAC